MRLHRCRRPSVLSLPSLLFFTVRDIPYYPRRRSELRLSLRSELNRPNKNKRTNCPRGKGKEASQVRNLPAPQLLLPKGPRSSRVLKLLRRRGLGSYDVVSALGKATGTQGGLKDIETTHEDSESSNQMPPRRPPDDRRWRSKDAFPIGNGKSVSESKLGKHVRQIATFLGAGVYSDRKEDGHRYKYFHRSRRVGIGILTASHTPRARHLAFLSRTSNPTSPVSLTLSIFTMKSASVVVALFAALAVAIPTSGGFRRQTSDGSDLDTCEDDSATSVPKLCSLGTPFCCRTDTEGLTSLDCAPRKPFLPHLSKVVSFRDPQLTNSLRVASHQGPDQGALHRRPVQLLHGLHHPRPRAASEVLHPQGGKLRHIYLRSPGSLDDLLANQGKRKGWPRPSLRGPVVHHQRVIVLRDLVNSVNGGDQRCPVLVSYCNALRGPIHTPVKSLFSLSYC